MSAEFVVNWCKDSVTEEIYIRVNTQYTEDVLAKYIEMTNDLNKEKLAIDIFDVLSFSGRQKFKREARSPFQA